MAEKPKWQLVPVTESEAHIVCTCGDVSAHISETDEGDFHIAQCVNGVWQRAENPLWPNLPSAMGEAERICRGTQQQQPNTPPPLCGEWQSCKEGIDAEDGDWIFLAWKEKNMPASSWKYVVAQMSCDEHFFELLDPDGDKIEWEPGDFYMRVKR